MRRVRAQGGRLIGCGVVIGLLTITTVMLSGCSSSTSGATLASASATTTSAAQDYGKAETLRNANHCDRAIPLYTQAIAKNGMYVNAYSGLAVCYQALGSYDAAIVDYDKAIAIDPTNYGLYIFRASVEFYNGSSGAAINDDKAALRLAPAQALAYVTIANSFASFADFADAIAAMNKAIAVAPGDPSLYENRGNIYRQAQDYPGAYKDYKLAIKVAPFLAARASIYYDLANVYDPQGDYNSAFSAIATAIRLQPDNVHYYVTSGNIHQHAGRLAVALTLYDQALHLVQKGGDAEAAFEGKGDTYAAMGQVNKAVAEYRRALRLTKDPNSRINLNNKITAVRSGQS